MFDESSEISITFRLTAESRDLIVDHAVAVNSALLKKFRLGVVEGKTLIFTFSLHEFMDLVDALASEAGHASTRHLRRRFSRIYDGLAARLNAFLESNRDLETATHVGPHAEFHREIHEALESESFANRDELDRRLQELSEAFNRRPMPEFDGLSPHEVSQLIYGNWEGQEATLVLSRELSLDDLDEAEILTNARVFLRALLEHDDTKATSAGNLNRKFVREMVERMSWPTGFLEDLKSFKKTWNEEDVFPLHTMRVVLVLAGLVRKIKGSFRITKRGEHLTRESAAGELYATLFQAFFRKFNLAYLDYLPECLGVQQTIAYSLFMVGRHATNWVSPQHLARKLFLPAVSAEIPLRPYGTDDEVLISRDPYPSSSCEVWTGQVPTLKGKSALQHAARACTQDGPLRGVPEVRPG